MQYKLLVKLYILKKNFITHDEALIIKNKLKIGFKKKIF